MSAVRGIDDKEIGVDGGREMGGEGRGARKERREREDGVVVGPGRRGYAIGSGVIR